MRARIAAVQHMLAELEQFSEGARQQLSQLRRVNEQRLTAIRSTAGDEAVYDALAATPFLVPGVSVDHSPDVLDLLRRAQLLFETSDMELLEQAVGSAGWGPCGSDEDPRPGSCAEPGGGSWWSQLAATLEVAPDPSVVPFPEFRRSSRARDWPGAPAAAASAALSAQQPHDAGRSFLEGGSGAVVQWPAAAAAARPTLPPEARSLSGPLLQPLELSRCMSIPPRHGWAADADAAPLAARSAGPVPAGPAQQPELNRVPAHFLDQAPLPSPPAPGPRAPAPPPAWDP